MNTNMTRCTQDSEVIQSVIRVAFVNMMYIKLSFMVFADKAFIFIKRKCQFSVIPRSYSVISIFRPRSFKSIPRYFLTFLAAEFRCFFSGSLVYVRRTTNNTRQFNFSIPLITRPIPAISRTKMNGSRLLFRDITRSFFKFFSTEFTVKKNKFVTSRIVTFSGAEFCSPFFK